MDQDTGKFRTNDKDQFYTKVDIAKKCISTILEIVPYINEYIWIEPSAGNGAFFNNIPNFKKIGIDIEPKAKDILKEDFLKWGGMEIPKESKIIIFGNPPFGRQSSLAKAFIKKSCKIADIVAFILPRSFVKPSMNNSFDKKFHLIHSIELEKGSFEINGKTHHVPCVFQIWEKKNECRIIPNKILPIGFKYTKPNELFDIAFRRVGGLAGKCKYYQIGIKFSPSSHYFLKLENNNVDNVIEKINNHVFPSNTVGPRSLSKTEVNEVINKIILSI